MFETMSIETLQAYWWIIVSLLGSLLVFLMFVQGGQTLIYTIGKTETERKILVNTLGRKWEFPLRASGDAVPLPDDLREAIRHYEKKHILEIMQKAQFNKEAAAKVLNIGLSSLYRKIDELGITPEELKGRV